MPKHRVETRFRNRFGVRRTDTRTVEADGPNEVIDRMIEIREEIEARPGIVILGGSSKPI